MCLGEVCRLGDALERRTLEEYGAMFLAADSVRVPPRCVFTSEEEVQSFQQAAAPRAEQFGGAVVELQPAAMEALVAARVEARRLGLDIGARGGAEAGRRAYADTLRLWESRFLPALAHWCERGRLSESHAGRLRALDSCAQVREVLKLEREEIFFSRDFKKTVFRSVAAPGASQHLSMCAFDVAEFGDATVRALLARHGWFQTVLSDLPHFTYLGLAEEELPAHGLRCAEAHGQTFWVPDVGDGA